MGETKCTDQILNIDASISYIMGLLEIYDDNLKNGKIEGTSPYYDKIFMEGKNSKTIEIPYDVQQEAIKKWNVKKMQNNYEQKKTSINNEIKILAKQLKQLDDEEIESDGINQNIYVIIIIIMTLVIGFVMYLYSH